MEEDLIPFLPPGLAPEVLQLIPEEAREIILNQARSRYETAQRIVDVNFALENEYVGVSEMFKQADIEAQERIAELHEAEMEVLNEQLDGVNTMFEMAEREIALHDEVLIAHTYDDLFRLFDRFPTARFTVRMYSGKIVTCTERSLRQLLYNGYGSYDDVEDVNGNFEILSIVRHDPYVDEILHRRTAEDMGDDPHWQQPSLSGIDDVRYSIEEFHAENEYFVPTNLNCVGKCIFKFLDLVGHRREDHPELEKINFDTTTTITTMNALLKKKESKIRVVSYTTRPNQYYNKFIRVPIYKYELPDKRGYFHAILVLNANKYRNMWRKNKKLPDVDVHVTYTEFEDLSEDKLEIFRKNEEIKLGGPPKSEKEKEKERIKKEQKLECVYGSFDFETRKDHDDALTFTPVLSPTTACRLFKHVPSLITWAWSPTDADYALDLENPSNVVNGKFLSQIKQKLSNLNRTAKKDDNSVREVMLFSFNGTAFDNHLFLGYLDHPDWKVCPRGYIGDEMSIKRFSITNTRLKFPNKVTFLDLRLFFTQNVSLKKAGEMYCANEKKHDFDIVEHMTKAKIFANKEKYIEYGMQDSRTLFEITMKHRDYLKEVSEKPELDMFDCVSIANYADKLRDLYHPEEHEVWYNKRDEIAEFMRKCVVGGRLIVGQLKCDEPSIAVDFNGLYGSAMYLHEYPTGSREFLNRKNHFKRLEDLKNSMNAKEETKLFLAKVRFTINPKCLISLLPIKDDSNPKGVSKTGYFSSVALKQAIEHGGYVLDEILFAIEIASKGKIYSNFIDVFNTKRTKYKSQMKSLPKKEKEFARFNVLQDLCKLITNSSYGSHLTKKFEYEYTVMTEFAFMKDHDPTLEVVTKCGHKQLLVRYPNQCKHQNKRTIEQGVFILDYSKVIFNKALTALDAFFKAGVVLYGDTDSVYIRKRDLHLLEKAGLIGSKMGQAKNDYDDQFIMKAIFLGKKMKVCLLDDGSVKSTLKGFKGLNKLSHTEKLDLFDRFDYVVETGNTEVFMSRKYETMRRSGFCISSKVETRSFRVTAHDQYQVVDNTCYPLYYDITGPLEDFKHKKEMEIESPQIVPKHADYLENLTNECFFQNFS